MANPSNPPERQSREKEQQYHFLRVMNDEASPEQRIMAAQALADGQITDTELDAIHSLYLKEGHAHLRSALLRILILKAFHRNQVQKLIKEVCNPHNEADSHLIPTIADSLRSLDWKSESIGIYDLTQAFSDLLQCLNHQHPHAVEAAAQAILDFDDQLMEGDDDEKTMDLRAEWANMFGPDEHAKMRQLMLEHESGWVRYACADLLDRSGEDIPEEWAGVVKSARLVNELKEKTLEDTFQNVYKKISQINKYRPFETSLTDEQIALLDREVREAPRPLELLQSYLDNGARLVLVECQHCAGEAIKRVAKEICALRENAGLTHFALPMNPKLEKSLHRFIDGEVSEYLHEFFEHLLPDCLDPSMTPVQAVTNYREALREIRDSGLKIVLYHDYPKGISYQGENTYDHQVNLLFEPIKQFGKMLVYHDENETFSVTRVPLTDKHAKMKLSLATGLLRELDQDERAVVSVLQQTEQEVISQSSIMKMHNLDHFFNRSSFSRDIGLKLGSSQLDSLRFREFTRERFREAWHAFIVRADDESGDREEDEIPDIPEPAVPPVPSPLLAYIGA